MFKILAQTILVNLLASFILSVLYFWLQSVLVLEQIDPTWSIPNCLIPKKVFLLPNRSAIASKLNSMDSLVANVATLKAQTSCTQQEETNHKNRIKGKSVWQEEEEDIDSVHLGQNFFPESHIRR